MDDKDWNYRVIRHVDDEGDEYYDIHVVTYDENGNLFEIMEGCEAPMGPNIDHLAHDIFHMFQAFLRPVLDYEPVLAHSKETVN